MKEIRVGQGDGGERDDEGHHIFSLSLAVSTMLYFSKPTVNRQE